MVHPVVAVAYSGGRDSTALLHVTLKAAASHGVEVVALHVHHGLNPAADRWLAHCKAQCERWARRGLPVRFDAERLSERPARGESVEAWARSARYRALARMAGRHAAPVVLLAHHRRDQAETLLLQALRGAGVAGLAGMPARFERDGITWLRPWLSQPREAIETYLRRHRLGWVEDDSNLDARFARNRLRLQVWPALVQAFPGAEGSLADSAERAHEASACLAELAALDLAAVAPVDDLDLEAWQRLSAPRRANALRYWLRSCTGAPAATTLVSRLLDELPRCRSARWPLPDGELRAYRGRLSFLRTPAHRPDEPAAAAAARERMLAIRRAGVYRLPGWGGRLRVTRVKDGGVPLAWLAQLELRQRGGAEQFQSGLGRPPRSLKKQYQAAGLPAWQRGGPLVYSGGQLVFVPGLGLDARVIALPGQAQATLEWLLPDPP